MIDSPGEYVKKPYDSRIKNRENERRLLKIRRPSKNLDFDPINVTKINRK